MEKNLYIDASHPDETRIVLKSENHIEEYEYENKNKLNLKNNVYCRISRSKIHGVGVIAIKDIPKGINPFKKCIGSA